MSANKNVDDTLNGIKKLIDKATTLQDEAHHAVYKANMALEAFSPVEGIYVRERERLDVAAAHLAVGKWKSGRATEATIGLATSSDELADLSQAREAFEQGLKLAIQARMNLEKGQLAESPKQAHTALGIKANNTEIDFIGDVPLVPTVCPVVVLRGSSRQMGYQYAEQIVQIYGNWIFEEISRKVFSEDAKTVIKRWAEELERWAPDVVEFAKGWADGATKAGVPTTELQILSLWTGEHPPAGKLTPMGFRGQESNDKAQAYLAIKPLDEMPCSGACAWGAATADGALVAASTTDHDCTHQATIVAYPDCGNAFIYTPFSVTGVIPVIGQYFMAGHPGMNNKGVAYVHHGGGLHSNEPPELWGYGVRRGASTFHLLWHANSAQEAFNMEMAMPIGEANGILGSVGGFYADKDYAYVLESRHNPDDEGKPIIRDKTDVNGNPESFLYANNNSLHQDTRNGYVNGAPGGFCGEQTEYLEYDSVAGWHVDIPAEKMPATSSLQLLLTMSTKSSQGRNRFMYRSLSPAVSKIDSDHMFRMYRTPADIDPMMPLEEISENYLNGKKWDVSAAQRANAFTSIMVPDNGPNGKYWACIGPAKRGLPAIGPAHGFYYYDETAAFWELTLANTPKDMYLKASACAVERLSHAKEAINSIENTEAKAYYQNLMDKATSAIEKSNLDGRSAARDDDISAWSRAIRNATRAQVRAQQVIDAVHVPGGLVN